MMRRPDRVNQTIKTVRAVEAKDTITTYKSLMPHYCTVDRPEGRQEMLGFEHLHEVCDYAEDLEKRLTEALAGYNNSQLPQPTEPGWWWLKEPGIVLRPYNVVPNRRKKLFTSLLQAGYFPKGEWTGPIPEPPGGRAMERPIIVCLCGSTRFSEAFTRAQLKETLAGKIVLTIGCNMKTDQEIFTGMSRQELKSTKTKLDQLHFRKIEMADEILILNVGGYIGLSTCDELYYAKALNKPIRFLEPPVEEKHTPERQG